MTREIKFRGIMKRTKQWIYGDLAHVQGQTCIQVDVSTDEKKTVVMNVDPDSVGQFIGLHDSKCNDIYEGDIVYIQMNDGSDCNCVIGYDNDILAFGIMDEYAYRSMIDGYNRNYDNGFMHRLYEDGCIFEVIGNIHDNPELLEGGEK